MEHPVRLCAGVCRRAARPAGKASTSARPLVPGPPPARAVCPAPPRHAGIQGPGSWASQCRICPRVTGPRGTQGAGSSPVRPARATGSGCAQGCRRPARTGWRAGRGPTTGRVQAEDLRLDRVGQGRVAVALLELGGDLERAEGHDLGLRRAVPDAVGAPQHPVLAEPREQLAQHVRGLHRVGQQAPPHRGDVGPDIAVGRHLVVGRAPRSASQRRPGRPGCRGPRHDCGVQAAW